MVCRAFYGYALVILLLAGACSTGVFPVREAFETTQHPPAPDYANPAHWASLPTKKDAADSLPKGVLLSNNQATAAADVFFIYPTIFTGKPYDAFKWNADVTNSKLNSEIQQSTILNQASVFNGSCRIYAPYYRQAHLYAFFSNKKNDADAALKFAYADVRAAFVYYLENFNDGRPIVIASHSQGSYHAELLLKEFFDGQPLQHQLVAAYLIGRAFKPDTFKNIRLSQNPRAPGVWATWNTYAQNFYPKNHALYFAGAASTNPLLWNSSKDFANKELNVGGVGPKFTFYPQLADAQNHDGMLWINKPYIKGRALIRTKRWHYADINLFYMNIRENVAQRLNTFLELNAGAQAK